MRSQDKDALLKKLVKYFMISVAIVEILSVIMYTLTELGNIGSNFWLTNVFAGSWCGLILLVHIPLLFVAETCFPTPSVILWTIIITIVNLVATALLIAFNGVFLAQPSTCILTSSCSSNAISTGVFSYTFQQNFFTVFNSLGPFRNYTQSQAKYLFQTVQISVGSLCFVLNLACLIIYVLILIQGAKRVKPIQRIQDSEQVKPTQRIQDSKQVKPTQQFYRDKIRRVSDVS